MSIETACTCKGVFQCVCVCVYVCVCVCAWEGGWGSNEEACQDLLKYCVFFGGGLEFFNEKMGRQ